MGSFKQINIKNQTYSFFNYIIDIKDFDSSLPKIDNKSDKKIVFTTLDTSQLKKLLIIKILIL